MKIEYLGHSCFLFTTEAGTRVVTDPFQGIGLPPPSVTADVLTISHCHYDHDNVGAVTASSVYTQAGENVFRDVEINSFLSFHDDVCGRKRGTNLIFRFKMDGITICHMGDLGEFRSEKIARSLSGTDVLLIPVGGNYTIDAEQAKWYVEKIQPAIVIPMHYYVPDLTVDIASLDGFLNLFPKDRVEKKQKLEISRAALPVDGVKIIILERTEYAKSTGTN